MNTASAPRMTDRHNTSGSDLLDFTIAALLAATVFIAGIAVITVGVCGVYHDDAVYVSTAKALAEGRGYRLINLPAAPLQTRYPILYPAALAAIWRLWPTFPENLFAMQALSVGLGAMTVAAAYLYAVRIQQCPRIVAGLGVALAATTPTFAYFCTQTLSEIPFALSLIGALWVVARERAQVPPRRGRELLVGVVVAIPCLLRLLGGAIVLPLLWTLWRRNRRVLRYAIGAFAPLIAWFAWVWFARHDAGAVRMAMNNPDSWDWLENVVSRGARPTVGYNLLILTVATADIFPSIWKSHVAIAFPIAGVLTWAVMIVRGRLGLGSALIAYAAVILIWPWPPGRFLVPLWPLLAPFALTPIYRRLGGAAPVILVAVVAIGGNVIGLNKMFERNRATHYPTLPLDKLPPQWSAYERMFSWIRTHTESDDVIVVGLDPMFFLYTGRSAMRGFDLEPLSLFYGTQGQPVGTQPAFAALLARRSGEYLARTPMPGFAEEQPYEALVQQLRHDRPRVSAAGV